MHEVIYDEVHYHIVEIAAILSPLYYLYNIPIPVFSVSVQSDVFLTSVYGAHVDAHVPHSNLNSLFVTTAQMCNNSIRYDSTE